MAMSAGAIAEGLDGVVDLGFGDLILRQRGHKRPRGLIEDDRHRRMTWQFSSRSIGLQS
jgi:hypothetical protein